MSVFLYLHEFFSYLYSSKLPLAALCQRTYNWDLFGFIGRNFRRLHEIDIDVASGLRAHQTCDRHLFHLFLISMLGHTIGQWGNSSRSIKTTELILGAFLEIDPDCRRSTLICSSSSPRRLLICFLALKGNLFLDKMLCWCSKIYWTSLDRTLPVSRFCCRHLHWLCKLRYDLYAYRWSLFVIFNWVRLCWVGCYKILHFNVLVAQEVSPVLCHLVRFMARKVEDLWSKLLQMTCCSHVVLVSPRFEIRTTICFIRVFMYVHCSSCLRVIQCLWRPD